MKNTVGKSDTDIKTDVLSELKFEPTVKETDIGVLVKEGTVTLNGEVPSYFEKWDAVRAAKRVAGVRAIADEIDVKLPDFLRYTDTDIAAAAANHIQWSSKVPEDSVKVTVREGWITLEGEVEWWYQRNAADNLVRHLKGVKGVSNLVTIKPTVNALEVEAAIKSAFERNAVIDAAKIQVETADAKVTLFGKVRNYAERDEAERVAWSASGVYSVDNKLTVGWSFPE
jgi:osmotically-inducible protein OsmY